MFRATANPKGSTVDDYDFEEYDEYGADPSDWDDLGTLSDNEGWESGQADMACDDHLDDMGD